MDVLTAAWTAAGQPSVTTTRVIGAGPCARCRDWAEQLVATRAVISKTFTGYDTWAEPTGAGLCQACSWGYRTPSLRAQPHLVTAGPRPRLEPLDSGGLSAALAVPVGSSSAVVVPLRRGRKHVLVTAAWGRVTVDDAHLPWTTGDAARLEAMHRLRELGFGPRMLTEPVPPWPVLRRLPGPSWQPTITDWDALRPWRARRLFLDLALLATNPGGRSEVPA